MSREAAAPLHADVLLWAMDAEGKALQRTLKFRRFTDGIAFVNKVAALAEEEGHHPDITINYRRVTFTLTTHAIGGLSENDFILAAKIDVLYQREQHETPAKASAAGTE